MGESTSWEGVILKTAKYVNNVIIFLICLVLAFVLSMYKMPLSNLTQSIVDWSYSHFSFLITDVYESGSDPITFSALIITLLIYAVILFTIIKMLMRFIKNKHHT